jgi:hypothetical protein
MAGSYQTHAVRGNSKKLNPTHFRDDFSGEERLIRHHCGKSATLSCSFLPTFVLLACAWSDSRMASAAPVQNLAE